MGWNWGEWHKAPTRRCRAFRHGLAAARAADRPHVAATSAATEEAIAAVRLEARHDCSSRQVELLEDLAGFGIDAPDVAFLAFPGAVPEFAVDPGDAGDEAFAFDGP